MEILASLIAMFGTWLRCWLILAFGAAPAWGADHETLQANAVAIISSIQSNNHTDLQKALEQRQILTEPNLTDWLSLKIATDPLMQNDLASWASPLRQSIGAHYEKKPEQSLQLAELAATQGTTEPLLLPGLWLSHLEIWPKQVQSFEQFVGLRQTGLARLEKLFERFPNDRRLALITSQARMADGRIVEAVKILDELEKNGALDQRWRRKADILARWRPALNEDRIAKLRQPSPLRDNSDNYFFGDLTRLGGDIVADPLIVDALDLSAMPELHKLAATGDAAILATVLPTVLNIDQPAIRGDAAYSPVHLAAELGNLEALAAFADHGAAIDQPADPVTGLQSIAAELGSGVAGATPLQVAALHGRSDMARALIELGANVDVAAADQISPLLAATAMGDSSMVDELINAGARPDNAHTSLGSARDLAQSMNLASRVPDMPSIITASPAQMGLLQAGGMASGMGQGISAPFGALASTMIGVVASDSGQKMLAHGLISSWQNGTLFVRIGMLGSLFFLGFLFKQGPKILSSLIKRFMEAEPDREEADLFEGFDPVNKTYRGKLSAPAFGITEGGEFEVLGNGIIVTGFGPRNQLFAVPAVGWIIKFLIFLILFTLSGLIWAATITGFDLSQSTDAQLISFILVLFFIPLMSFLADGLGRILTTHHVELAIEKNEIGMLMLERSSTDELQMVANISKNEWGEGGLWFSAKRGEIVQAAVSEWQRFSGICPTHA